MYHLLQHKYENIPSHLILNLFEHSACQESIFATWLLLLDYFNVTTVKE